MATDLRFLTAAIKINNDLERMGDLAVNIAERALSLIAQPPVKPLIDIPRMARLAESMVRERWTPSSSATPTWRAASCSPTTPWTTCGTRSARNWSVSWSATRPRSPARWI